MSLQIWADYVHETVVLGREHWAELDRCCRESDPDSQAALLRLLDRHGRVRARRRVRNLVPTAACTWAGQTLFASSAYTAAFYLGLKSTGTPAASDTMASHAAWTELTSYTQANRPTLQLGSWTNGVASNSSNPALFTASAALTVGGAFITTANGKGGTTGTLFSATNFTGGTRSVASGATEKVTATITITGS